MIDIDRFSFDVECPECRFATKIFYRDARLRDVLICRGCKANIQLNDHMNECRKVRSQVSSAIADLERTVESLGKTFRLNF
ncbi:hypothetical protein [Variovorax sp. 3P27G3]|jgi:hypothetical protein|uniref:hypothetical protein n=1 Tax=Variovorax sp. 3P27G3 TaxID=2502214 RepID=UPI000FB0A5B1|nr:hypothetical protein [Variovorax sp. 3P27G3]RSZ31568.1 hypothetical protein EJO71_31655 [Variovorax sp. 679]